MWWLLAPDFSYDYCRILWIPHRQQRLTMKVATNVRETVQQLVSLFNPSIKAWSALSRRRSNFEGDLKWLRNQSVAILLAFAKTIDSLSWRVCQIQNYFCKFSPFMLTMFPGNDCIGKVMQSQILCESYGTCSKNAQLISGYYYDPRAGQI